MFLNHIIESWTFIIICRKSWARWWFSYKQRWYLKIFYIYIEQSICQSVFAEREIRFGIIFSEIVSYSKRKDGLFEMIVTLSWKTFLLNPKRQSERQNLWYRFKHWTSSRTFRWNKHSNWIACRFSASQITEFRSKDFRIISPDQIDTESDLHNTLG